MRTLSNYPKEKLSWKWYTYGPHHKFDAWSITNRVTGVHIITSTESACLKIIELAYALKTGGTKPLNHSTLEKKAKDLEGIPHDKQKYWTWNGKQLTYDTSAYDESFKLTYTTIASSNKQPDTIKITNSETNNVIGWIEWHQKKQAFIFKPEINTAFTVDELNHITQTIQLIN